METIQPGQPIIENLDGSWTLPNPSALSLICLARYARTMIQEGDTVVVRINKTTTRAFDFRPLSEQPIEEINGQCMLYARVMHQAQAVTALPPDF